MSQPLSLGIAGLGTVGAGLLRLLKTHGARLSETVGRDIVIGGITARNGARIATSAWKV